MAFADDLALLVEADDDLVLRTRAEYALDTIQGWIRDYGLSLTAHKTESLVMKGPRNREGIQFDLIGARVTPSRAVKYLGVHLDSQGIFGKHITEVTAEADRVVAAMSRVMPNIGGPSTMKRLALCGVVHSIVLYGAPVWARAMSMTKYKNMVTGTQRRALLRAACTYRTVSSMALQVVLRVLPIDIMVGERARLHAHGDGHRPMQKSIM